MSGQFQLRHYPVVLPASSTTPIVGQVIGGIFCTGAGTFTVNGTDDQGNAFQIVSFTGTANTWYPLPFYIGPRRGTVVTGAGATGTLAA